MKLLSPKVLFPLAALFLLTGCVKLDMGLKVNANGHGAYSMAIDLTGLTTLGSFGGMNLSKNSSAFDAYKSARLCQTLSKGATSGNAAFDLGKAQCEPLGDYKAKLAINDVDLVQKKLLAIHDSLFSRKYVLTFHDPSLTTIFGNDSSSAQTAQLKALGAAINLNIEMPGTISSATIGKISADKKSVAIDLLADFDKIHSGIVVVSEDANYDALLGIAAGALVLLLAARFLFIKKKPSKQKKQE